MKLIQMTGIKKLSIYYLQIFEFIINIFFYYNYLIIWYIKLTAKTIFKNKASIARIYWN